MAETGVNVETNAGRVNVPEATEETPSLVLPLEVDAEENKGCGAPLAETPEGTNFLNQCGPSLF